MRCHAFSFAARALLLAATLSVPALAEADELVTFPAAAARSGADQAAIQGYLVRPLGAGRHPAIVVLHSCLGLRADRPAIGKRLASWGYVALFVDDFSTRGLKDSCAVDFPEGLADAFGALAFISRLPFVDRTSIAALGYSQGAATALQIATLIPASGFVLPRAAAFKAVAALYPACASIADARLHLPTLILIGAEDTVTPAAPCGELAAMQPGEVELKVYPGAAHVFDDPQFAGGKTLMGMRLAFDRSAALAAQADLRDFLAATLGR